MTQWRDEYKADLTTNLKQISIDAKKIQDKVEALHIKWTQF